MASFKGAYAKLAPNKTHTDRTTHHQVIVITHHSSELATPTSQRRSKTDTGELPNTPEGPTTKTIAAAQTHLNITVAAAKDANKPHAAPQPLAPRPVQNSKSNTTKEESDAKSAAVADPSHRI